MAPLLRPLALAALLAALPLLAGCVGTAQATAKDSLNPADEAAKAWAADAELARITGAEGAWRASEARAADFARAASDEKVGDGRCEVWAYRYVAASQARAYVVVVDRDGRVVRAGEEAKQPGERALGAWRVDSDEALRIAKGASEGLREGTQKESFGVVSTLKLDAAGTPVWTVTGGGGDRTGGGGGVVRLDAANGKVLSAEGGYGSG